MFNIKGKNKQTQLNKKSKRKPKSLTLFVKKVATLVPKLKLKWVFGGGGGRGGGEEADGLQLVLGDPNPCPTCQFSIVDIAV